MRLAPGLQKLDWLIARPIAHRGLHDINSGIVENTMAAFAAAMAGNYAIECDLQLTADGEAMVFHDQTLDRLTAATGPVVGRTAAELKKMKLRRSAETIPTLDELLHGVRGRVPLLLELKSHWNGRTTLVYRALEVLKTYRGRFGLMSFDPDLVEAMKYCSPATVRGIVADRADHPSWRRLPLPRRLQLRHFLHLERTLPHFVAYDAGGLPWPPVQRLRQAGVPVVSWTVRSAAEASAVRRYCDQITFEGFRP
jgi:glycerophosphoryl diester phosphodiesterase